MTLIKILCGFIAYYVVTFGFAIAGTLDTENVPRDVTDTPDDYGSADDASGAFPIDDQHDYQSYEYDHDFIIADSGNISNGLPFPSAMPPKIDYYQQGMTCGDGTKIGQTQICNGQVDCFDCSDEENCPYDSHNIFMCYEKGDTEQHQFHYDNPKCIGLTKFCDGKSDCQNGADERQVGLGFRCTIANRFRQCILPQRYLCDDMPHCEDRADMCPGIWGKDNSERPDESVMSLPQDLRPTTVSHGLFQCLDKKLVISQKQLCDGNFDCFDLSDECLCDVYRSEVAEEVCNGLCAKPLWDDQSLNPDCKFCNQGEVYWKSPLFLTEGRYRNDFEDKSPCFSTSQIVEKVEMLLSAKTKSVYEESGYDVIECFDMNFSPVRARKCDKRPECMSGEDECGIGCKSLKTPSNSGSGSGDFENDNTNSTDPEFCKLLTKDHKEFVCQSWMDENGSRKAQYDIVGPMNQIIICNGKQECADGSDELFCPKRITCNSNNTSHISDKLVESFDVTQLCDGHRHCLNGKDEDPLECQTRSFTTFSCDGKFDFGKPNPIFSRQHYLDGEKHCEAGADECPPFFSKIPAVEDLVYGNRKIGPQIGISTHDAAIGSMALQIFVITISLVGASALAVSFALGLYNITVSWFRLRKSRTKLTRRSFAIYIREAVVYIGITVSKGLLCGFFAYIRIKRSEESNYSAVDLEWRSSLSCSVAGTIAMIGCQIPVLTLAIFVIGFLIFDWSSKKMKKKIINENSGSSEDHFYSNNGSSGRTKCLNHMVLVIACLVLIIIIWLPTATTVVLLQTPSDLHFQTETYGWMVARGAPQIFQANLISQDNAKRFVRNLIALTQNTSQSIAESDSAVFSFSRLPNVVNNISPELRLESLGSFGYFSQSGSCLPAFLVHVTGGEAPFDIAVSNLHSAGLSILIMVINFAVMFCAGILTTRYGIGVSKMCLAVSSSNERYYILNRTFSRLVAIETITWVVITLSFLLKSIDTEIASDRTYATICIVTIGANCGIITPFVLLMRKFRVGESTDYMQDRRLRSRKQSSDAQRIIEERESCEEQHLAGKSNQSCDNPVKIQEMSNLMENISDQ